jgi:hypothetical protein
VVLAVVGVAGVSEGNVLVFRLTDSLEHLAELAAMCFDYGIDAIDTDTFFLSYSG